MKKKDSYLNKLYVNVNINENNQVTFKFMDDRYFIQISQNPHVGSHWSRVKSITEIDKILYNVAVNYINYLVDRVHLLYKQSDFMKLSIVLEDKMIEITLKEKDKDGNVVENKVSLDTNDAAILEFLYPGSFSSTAKVKQTMFTTIKDDEQRRSFEGLLNLVYNIYRDSYLFDYRQELI